MFPEQAEEHAARPWLDRPATSLASNLRKFLMIKATTCGNPIEVFAGTW